MRIALYSDLHFRFDELELWEPPALAADVVLLAGDLGPIELAFSWAADHFGGSRILYVAGNHDFYGRRLDEVVGLRAQAAQHGIELLENCARTIQDVRFLGATLWTDYALYGQGEPQVHAMEAAGRGIQDFYSIRDGRGGPITPAALLRPHRESVAFLEAELRHPFPGKTVVVTHFAPHRGCIAPWYQGGALTPYFVCDLAPLMAQHRIDLWCHGHTHTNTDFLAEGGCRVLSNQRGYLREVESGRMGFREKLIIEL